MFKITTGSSVNFNTGSFESPTHYSDKTYGTGYHSFTTDKKPYNPHKELLGCLCEVKINTSTESTVVDEVESVIFNPPATVVKWKDGTTTVVKATNKDNFDPIIGFLYAYFEKHSNLTRTQSNKFLDKMEVTFEEQKKKMSLKQAKRMSKKETV